MRPVLVAILLSSLTSPAIAAEPESQREVEKLADTLNDPATQAAVAASINGVVSAVLDIRIDGMAKAIEAANGRRTSTHLHDKTVRDLATRDDPAFERRLQSDARQAVGAAGGLASAMAVMLPELREAVRKMKDALPPAH